MDHFDLPLGFEIKAPVTSDELKKYYELRWEVLRKDWNRPRGSEKDEGEESALHAMITNEQKEVIAVCRLQIIDEHQGQIRSMAVREDYRGKGYGGIILKYLEKFGKQKGLRKIFLDGRELAVPFYEKMGYKIVAKSYLLYDTIQHYRMEKFI